MHTFVKLKPQTAQVDRKLSEAYHQRELYTWRPFRHFGVFAAFAAISFTVISVCSNTWIQGRGESASSCQPARVVHAESAHLFHGQCSQHEIYIRPEEVDIDHKYQPVSSGRLRNLININVIQSQNSSPKIIEWT